MNKNRKRSWNILGEKQLGTQLKQSRAAEMEQAGGVVSGLNQKDPLKGCGWKHVPQGGGLRAWVMGGTTEFGNTENGGRFEGKWA